ncbi:hypothetical protein AAFF_G00201190 [Aldrovandia affinis]|uniref:H15 domain-containing protein n=1 Tax=Aldrovandia affinis TaxID=143900 RepID=A0AAD7SWU0_9TELE|nr:hypothetical protein AAFF_G00201190 [Aldrovandia affinis]
MARKRAAASPKKACCSYRGVSELIVEAVSASKERSGVSMACLEKALAAGGYDVAHNVSQVKQAVKSLVTKGALLQSTGTGGSVCLMLNVGAKASKGYSPSPKKVQMRDAPRKAARSPKKTKAPKRKAAKAKRTARKKK